MDTSVSFMDLHIEKEILKAVQNMGFEEPSPVQAAVIPIALGHKDIIVQAQTGTGKTVAFGIPIVEKTKTDTRNIQAVVLAPTRELAIQVSEEITKLGRFKRLRAVAIYGGQPIDVQKRVLNQRVHIVVGTPGRMLDQILRGNIDLAHVQILVIDEADKMFDLGLGNEVREILEAIPKTRQTMMFSATITGIVEELAETHMISPQKITMTPQQITTDKIRQCHYLVSEGAKFSLLLALLADQEGGAKIVFCRTKKAVDKLTSHLNKLGYPVLGLQGDMLQEKRLETIRSFKRGDRACLIATDVAARGLDIEDVTHVINFDIPLDAESYIHRIGRTGRAGNEGTAITFVTEAELGFLRKIEEFTGYAIPKQDLPPMVDVAAFQRSTAAQVKAKQVVKSVDEKGRLDGEITRLHISAGRKNKVRPTDIVGAITGATGLAGEVIGVIEIYDNYSFVDIMQGYGERVLEAMGNSTIKGKPIRVERAK